MELQLKSDLVCIIVLLVVCVQSSANEFADPEYITAWQEAKKEVEAESWNSALPHFEKAISSLDRASGLDSGLSHEQKLDLAQIRSDYGLALLRTAWMQSNETEAQPDHLQQARTQLNLSIEAARILDASEILADAYNNLAGWYFVAGAESKVIDHLLLAQQYYELSSNFTAAATISNNLGMMYRKLGEFRSAQSAFHSGLKALSHEGNLPEKAALHFNASGLYHSLGDLERAKLHAQSSLDIYQAAGKPRSEMRSRTLLATIQRELGEAALAYKEHSKAGEYFKSQNLSHYFAVARQEQIIDLIQLGRMEDAFLTSQSLLENQGDFDRQASKLGLYSNHATLLIERGEVAEALNFLNKALQTDESSNRDPIGKIELMNLRREIFASEGRVEDAISQAEAMFALIEDQRTEFETLRLGPIYSGKTNRYYTEHIEFLLNESSRLPESRLGRMAFETIERASSVSLRQRRQEIILNRNSLDAESREKWRQLVKSLLQSQASGSDVAENLEAERQFNAAHEAFFAANGLAIEVSSLSTMGVDQIQSHLEENQLALVYFEGPNSVWRFEIYSNEWNVLEIGKSTEIQSKARTAFEELSRSSSGPVESTDLLSKLMFKGIAWRKGIKQILYVPANELHSIPLAALKLSGKSISDLAATIVVPSLSEFLALSNNIESDVDLEIAVFADPDISSSLEKNSREDTVSQFRNWSENLSRLPYSAEEAEMLRTLFPPQKTAIYLGREANRNNLFSESVLGARILHLATHGYFNADIPELVGLALAQDGKSDDGFVSMAEIAAQDINAQLVVISACDTTRGQKVAGEGVLSLSRVFLAQGVDSVISTLWPVSDKATAIFMKEFYHALKTQQLGLAESVRFAQQSLRKNRRYRDAFYWSPYILTSARSSLH